MGKQFLKVSLNHPDLHIVEIEFGIFEGEQFVQFSGVIELVSHCAERIPFALYVYSRTSNHRIFFRHRNFVTYIIQRSQNFGAVVDRISGPFPLYIYLLYVEGGIQIRIIVVFI